ncbi:hypothetical protein J4Q44_G00241090 [Coregonus suidteri]|uniref:Fatty acid-binding protein, liver n=2 Tax=Coregonus TaxID=27772 RepID=A0AAN8QGV1_9TELE
MFRVASEDSFDVYTDSVTGFIRKCIEDVVPTVMIRTYPNQKQWVDGSIRAKLKARTTTFNHGKVTGNMDMYKQTSYDLRKASLRKVTMAFTGKYQLESQENFEPFMKAIGLPDDLIQKGKDVKSVSEIEQNGDHFKVTVTTGTKVMVNSFTVGQEAELETITGEKIKSTVNLVGNKLIVSLKGIESVTEFNGDTVIGTMTLGPIVYKRISKRI